jgi:predicted MFS family arabinose efflux permease
VPLLPTSVVRDRQRVGAFLTVLFVTIGMFGVFLFLTYYFQRVLGYAPPKTGLAHLPITVGMITGSTQVAARLLNTIAASVTTRYATAHAGPGTDRRALASHAAVHGFNVATWWAMGSLPPAALIAGVVVDAHRVPTPEGRPAPVPEPVESVG